MADIRASWRLELPATSSRRSPDAGSRWSTRSPEGRLFVVERVLEQGWSVDGGRRCRRRRRANRLALARPATAPRASRGCAIAPRPRSDPAPHARRSGRRRSLALRRLRMTAARRSPSCSRCRSRPSPRCCTREGLGPAPAGSSRRSRPNRYERSPARRADPRRRQEARAGSAPRVPAIGSRAPASRSHAVEIGTATIVARSAGSSSTSRSTTPPASLTPARGARVSAQSICR